MDEENFDEPNQLLDEVRGHYIVAVASFIEMLMNMQVHCTELWQNFPLQRMLVHCTLVVFNYTSYNCYIGRSLSLS